MMNRLIIIPYTSEEAENVEGRRTPPPCGDSLVAVENPKSNGDNAQQHGHTGHSKGTKHLAPVETLIFLNCNASVQNGTVFCFF